MIGNMLKSPWQGHESGPIVYNISDKGEDEEWLTCEEDGIMKVWAAKQRRRRRRCIALYLGSFILLVTALVLLVVFSPTDTPPKSWMTHCAVEDCTFGTLAVSKNGRNHVCKVFCEKNLEWTKYADGGHEETVASSQDQLFGGFEKHGMCKNQQELTLGGSEVSLIPRMSSSHLPDFESLFVSDFNDEVILMIGDSVMKQAWEVLPMVLPLTYEVLTQHYEYKNDNTVGRVSHCSIDFEEQSQFCKHATGGDQYPCACSTVSTIKYGNTTINYAWAYGVEFEVDGGELESYGLGYNVLRPALYNKLARSATSIVMNMGVLPHHMERDTEGFSDFLHFVKECAKEKKVIYRLTMPQHFPTKNPDSTYLDEERLSGVCVPVAEHRHWTDTEARKVLKGKVTMIDQFSILNSQGGYHSNHGGDCNQWCLGYDLFYSFWGALAEAI